MKADELQGEGVEEDSCSSWENMHLINPKIKPHPRGKVIFSAENYACLFNEETVVASIKTMVGRSDAIDIPVLQLCILRQPAPERHKLCQLLCALMSLTHDGELLLVMRKCTPLYDLGWRPNHIDLLNIFFNWVVVLKSMALDSIFGWILMGKVEAEPPAVSSASYCISLLTLSPLEDVMRQFWEVEEFPPAKHKSVEEVHGEDLFVETHRRDATGRYVVCLPFRSSMPELGASWPQAVNRLLRLEMRFKGDLPLKQMYSDFTRDYLAEGHMEKVPISELSSSPTYYIPHHWVIKPESTTTKLCVMFDASSKSSTGVSLNDVLLTGPRLQCDIIDALLKVGLHVIVFTADIKQMYRQIAIYPSHQDPHCIVWRFDDIELVEDYRLKTVTYGVSSAPYLTLRTLQQLAEDEQKQFPVAANVLKSDIYVDDVVTGSNSV